jgi:hypothetical protein
MNTLKEKMLKPSKRKGSKGNLGPTHSSTPHIEGPRYHQPSSILVALEKLCLMLKAKLGIVANNI